MQKFFQGEKYIIKLKYVASVCLDEYNIDSIKYLRVMTTGAYEHRLYGTEADEFLKAYQNYIRNKE